jgi:hypothetical protein
VEPDEQLRPYPHGLVGVPAPRLEQAVAGLGEVAVVERVDPVGPNEAEAFGVQDGAGTAWGAKTVWR